MVHNLGRPATTRKRQEMNTVPWEEAELMQLECAISNVEMNSLNFMREFEVSVRFG